MKVKVAACVLSLFCALSAAGRTGRGQSPAEDPCAEAGSSRSMEACAEQELKGADAELKKAYDRLAAASEAAAERARLRRAQRAWLSYRRANCASEAFLYRGGTIQDFIQLKCMARVTRERRAEVEAQLKQYGN